MTTLTSTGKLDPHNFERQWSRILESRESAGVNLQHIIAFLEDLKNGVNVKKAHGKDRGLSRLCTLYSKLKTVNELLQEHYNTDMIRISEDNLQEFFHKLRDGEITQKNGRPYRSPGYYAKAVKQFWAWYMHKERRKGRKIEDKTVYLNIKIQKGRWTYLTFEQVKQMAEHARYDYRVLIWFLFDTGIRSPTELANFRTRDFTHEGGYYWVHIREETSKTKGRRFKVPLCGEIVARYIKQKKLKPDDQLFPISYPLILRNLQNLGYQVHKIGKQITKEGSKGKNLRRMNTYVVGGVKPYDLRHCSACYWVARHQDKPDFLLYRFAWSGYDMIKYYTEFLGLSDPTSHEDVIDEEERGVLKLNDERQRQRIEELESELKNMKQDMEELVSQKVAYHLQAMAPLLERKGVRIKKRT